MENVDQDQDGLDEMKKEVPNCPSNDREMIVAVIGLSNFDEVVKSQKCGVYVIPAKAGIQ